MLKLRKSSMFGTGTGSTISLFIDTQQIADSLIDGILNCIAVSCCGGTVEGGIVTDCCPNGLPTSLVATVSDQTGDCVSITGSFVMTYNNDFGDHRWVGILPNSACEISLICGVFNPDEFILDVTPCHATGNVTTVLQDCDTPEFIYDVDPFEGACTGTYRLTITS